MLSFGCLSHRTSLPVFHSCCLFIIPKCFLHTTLKKSSLLCFLLSSTKYNKNSIIFNWVPSCKICPLCYLSSSNYLSSPSSKVCWTHILKHLKTITTELQYFAWSTLNQKWCNKPLSVVDLSSCTHFIVYYCLSLFQWQ